jgi:small GTP-binding protein
VKQHEGSTTVALDFGVHEHKGYKLYVYGTPGQERFDAARKAASFGLHVGLVVVDSIRGMTGMEKRIIKELKEKNIPCIIIANKHDASGASLDGVMTASEGCLTLPVSAATGAGIDTMLDSIIESAKGRIAI